MSSHIQRALGPVSFESDTGVVLSPPQHRQQITPFRPFVEPQYLAGALKYETDGTISQGPKKSQAMLTAITIAKHRALSIIMLQSFATLHHDQNNT